ncbi:MAG: GDSL-type esterase/lipase family protein [Bacteroidota bacterium]
MIHSFKFSRLSYLRSIGAIAFFIAGLLGWCGLNAQKAVDIRSTGSPGKERPWKGFQRVDFTHTDRNARLVFPKKALPGNPWVWRARFPDWHTDADSLLLSMGFHLAYINTDDLYGSPKAVAIWDDFYKELTTEYDLNDQVSLAGVSRGGLFVYNWAKKNPDKVICIYGEAPVCDFKSWPLGKGTGMGSKKDWAQLKDAYGFRSDKEAMAYTNNPINGLEPLAQARIPILHMVHLLDSVVPYKENTQKLVNTYLKLGGPATVVPCNKGVRLHGHHFDIQTPQYVADFIAYHTQKSGPLNAAAYHAPRDGIANSKLKFERYKTARVAFLGGSITYNGGWRDSVMQFFEQRFPKTRFNFIAAGIPSMGTTPSAFRLERDVISKGPIDLLFVEAAVNDATHGRTAKEQIRGMEGIVRHIRKRNPTIDIILMHFVDPDKMKSYRAGKEPQVITNHDKVAIHYGLSSLNLAKEVTERIDNGEFSWEKDFQNLHPSPFGQGVYARSMIQFLTDAYDSYLDPDDKIKAYALPGKLDALSYHNGHYISISRAKLGKGWTIDPNWKPKDKTGTRQNYVNVPMLVGSETGREVQLNFEGTAVGIAVAAGRDAGIIRYRIDNGPWLEQNLFTKWSMHLHLPWYYTLANGLPQGKHRLTLRLSEKKDERSTGRVCRIRYFYVNGIENHTKQ